MSRFILNSDLQQMLVHFYRISGIRVGVHDIDMSVIVDYPQQSKEFEHRTFCEKCQNCAISFYRACNKCDRDAFGCARTSGSSYIYKCHLGFMEAVIPILSGGEPFCYLMIGQVKCLQEKKAVAKPTETVDDILKLYKVPAERYPAAMAYADYNKMPCMDFETFKSFVYFLELCGQKIQNDEYVLRDRMSFSNELIRYVKENLYNSVTIGDFAKRVGVSTSHLSHSIAKEMGTSFTKYLMHCRIEEAKRILRTTDMSVKRISLMLQYHDEAYFVRQFKQLTGMTCTQYRESKTGATGVHKNEKNHTRKK